MKRLRLGFVTVLAVSLIGVRGLRADSIELTSESAGVFGYGLVLDTMSPAVMVVNGDTVVFTGLAGVTGASAEGGTGFAATFTPTSVTFTETMGPVSTPGNPGSTPTVLPDLFLIDSTSSTLGTIAYSAASSVGAITGTAQGPVASATTPGVPEPSSLVLLGTGLLGAFGLLRRKVVA